jgi:type 1 fimbriae regulatory protein FimB
MKYWQPTELTAVLAAARKESVRNHLIVLLGYKHGLRATEITRLKLSDVAHGRCDVRRLKGSEHTNQPLESDENILLDEKRALAAYLRERPETPSVFLFVSEFGPRCGSGLSRQSIYNIFVDAAAAAGIEPGRRFPHCAKHTLGTLLYKGGADILVIKKLLGHKDLKASACYIELTADEAHNKGSKALSQMFA